MPQSMSLKCNTQRVCFSLLCALEQSCEGSERRIQFDSDYSGGDGASVFLDSQLSKDESVEGKACDDESPHLLR